MMDTLLDLSALQFLIVDDSVEMRDLLKRILLSLGSKDFYEAGDGSAAMATLKSAHIDIVLTDWLMEPVDGIAFTRQVRTGADSPAPMIPIIMISAHTERHRIAEARDAGVTEFLAKPLSPLGLYQRIEEVILRPRQFVQAQNYTGPDRHRHSDDTYSGPRRRQNDQERESNALDRMPVGASTQMGVGAE